MIRLTRRKGHERSSIPENADQVHGRRRVLCHERDWMPEDRHASLPLPKFLCERVSKRLLRSKMPVERNKMARKLRVGVIGANWTLNVHAPAWRMLPDVEVTAICTSREQTAKAAAQAGGIEKAYWNVTEMVQDPELDIIDVGTKPALRQDMVMAALEAGKHVYNCLPFAMSRESAEAMRDVAQAKGLVGAVDAQWRWTPAIRRMKEMIDEGAIGDFFLGHDPTPSAALRA
jgi:hypothetical protein